MATTHTTKQIRRHPVHPPTEVEAIEEEVIGTPPSPREQPATPIDMSAIDE